MAEGLEDFDDLAVAGGEVLHAGRHLQLALVDNGPLNILPNPPGGVGAEARILIGVEALDGPDQPEVSFVDEVGQTQSFVLVLLGNRNHKPQVSFG